MARVKIRGLNAIDKRTAAAQPLIAWRGELIADLGGQEACSAAKLALVELAVRTRLYVDSLDAWLLEQRSLISAKKRAVLPVVLQRQQLAPVALTRSEAFGGGEIVTDFTGRARALRSRPARTAPVFGPGAVVIHYSTLDATNQERAGQTIANMVIKELTRTGSFMAEVVATT